MCPEGRRRIIDMSDAIMRFAIKSLISKRNCYFFFFKEKHLRIGFLFFFLLPFLETGGARPTLI